MEDNKNKLPQSPQQTSSPTPPKSGVMDVQPPRPQNPTQPTGQSMESVHAEPQETSALGSEMHRPPDDDTSDQPLAELAAKTEDKKSDKPKLPVHDSGKRAPKAVISVAVVVAIGLIGLSVFAYMKTQDESPTAGTDITTHQDGDNHETPATVGDVNAATTQVDEALKSTDETDFSENELTDQSLGI